MLTASILRCLATTTSSTSEPDVDDAISQGLLLQGFPVHNIDEVLENAKGLRKVCTNAFFNDIAGNAFCGTVLLGILLPALLHLPWKSEERAMLQNVMASFLLDPHESVVQQCAPSDSFFI